MTKAVYGLFLLCNLILIGHYIQFMRSLHPNRNEQFPVHHHVPLLHVNQTSSGCASLCLENALVAKMNKFQLLTHAENDQSSMTTGPSVVGVFSNMLSERSSVPIDLQIDSVFPAEAAVNLLETECKWDGEIGVFQEKTCPLIQLGIGSRIPSGQQTVTVNPNEIDIVVPSIRNLDFLQHWKKYLFGLHLIIVQDGDPGVHLEIPDWVDYELYNRLDIEAALGQRSWIISQKDASIRNFGFLVSLKRYVYTLDDDCLPVDGIDPVLEHVRNLKRNATPYFFNTLYDPFRGGSDFVRGYPYSLRGGVPSVISHGLWLNVPDYDAPTQLLKPYERNTNPADVTQTVPFGVFYPMCSMNVAFDRELIGPAFMQGLMGVGQPWARYDDMFAGWASKFCADQMGYGVKSGQPYIVHNKASNPFTNLKKEFLGLYWQEDLIRFFSGLTTNIPFDQAATCYEHVADMIHEKFASKHQYFVRLSSSMRIWARLFDDPSIVFKPSRKQERPAMRSESMQEFKDWAVLPGNQRKTRLAVFTVVRNEEVFLPIWLRYYASQVDAQDIYILDNDSNDGSTKNVRYHVIKIHNELYLDHMWLVRQVQDFTSILLEQLQYQYVLFAEADEIIVPDPVMYPQGLVQYAQHATLDDIQCTGYNLCHNHAADLAPIDLTVSILKQRQDWYRVSHYDKPLLTNHVLDYEPGFHRASNMSGIVDNELYLIHLHYFDYNFCLARHRWKHEQKIKADDAERGWGIGSQSLQKSLLDCSCAVDNQLEPISRSLKGPTFLF